MKCLDKVLINDDFHEEVRGIVVEKRNKYGQSEFYNRNETEYLILFDWRDHKVWISENSLTKVDF